MGIPEKMPTSWLGGLPFEFLKFDGHGEVGNAFKIALFTHPRFRSSRQDGDAAVLIEMKD